MMDDNLGFPKTVPPIPRAVSIYAEDLLDERRKKDGGTIPGKIYMADFDAVAFAAKMTSSGSSNALDLHNSNFESSVSTSTSTTSSLNCSSVDELLSAANVVTTIEPPTASKDTLFKSFALQRSMNGSSSFGSTLINEPSLLHSTLRDEPYLLDSTKKRTNFFLGDSSEVSFSNNELDLLTPDSFSKRSEVNLLQYNVSKHCDSDIDLDNEPLTPQQLVSMSKNKLDKSFSLDSISTNLAKMNLSEMPALPLYSQASSNVQNVAKSTSINAMSNVRELDMDLFTPDSFVLSSSTSSPSLGILNDSKYKLSSHHDGTNNETFPLSLPSFKGGLTQDQNESLSSTTSSNAPPIGVFWDIENCQVPKWSTASNLIQAVRLKYFKDKKEAEFMVVCDINKENTQMVNEIQEAQVSVVHVASTAKNAADMQLIYRMRRYADNFGQNATIVLISGDVNFSSVLYDIRFHKNLHVILLHNAHAQDSLKSAAHESALYTDVIQEFPHLSVRSKPSTQKRELLVRNLPEGAEESALRKRLQVLIYNCGGKVLKVVPNAALAILQFQTAELATSSTDVLSSSTIV